LAQEPGKDELHLVDNDEAQALYDYCKHAIPHNEMLNRLARNHHLRIQALEKQVADLTAELKATKVGPQKRRMFRSL
jgi:hypothetical protein